MYIYYLLIVSSIIVCHLCDRGIAILEESVWTISDALVLFSNSFAVAICIFFLASFSLSSPPIYNRKKHVSYLQAIIFFTQKNHHIFSPSTPQWLRLNLTWRIRVFRYNWRVRYVDHPYIGKSNLWYWWLTFNNMYNILNIMSMWLLSTLWSCFRVPNSKETNLYSSFLSSVLQWNIITTYLGKAHMYMELMYFMVT